MCNMCSFVIVDHMVSVWVPRKSSKTTGERERERESERESVSV